MTTAAQSKRRRRVMVTAGDGQVLAVEHVPATGRVLGACVVGHAMGTNGRTMDRPRHDGLVSTLASAGLETYVVDLRGHGRSVSSQSDWCFDDIVHLDLPAVLSVVRERHPGLPILGLGHSLSGNALVAYAGVAAAHEDLPPVGALVTIATTIWLPRLERARRRRIVQRVVCEVVAAVAIRQGRFPARSLRLGSDDVSVGFSRDFRRWARDGVWSSREGNDYSAGLGAVDIPVLALFAAGDRLFCPPRAGRAFHDQLPPGTVEARVVGRSTVGFRPGHMDLVLDSRCRPVWESVADWCVEQLTKCPSST
jgi:predicted alpha/beta hydrolase